MAKDVEVPPQEASLLTDNGRRTDDQSTNIYLLTKKVEKVIKANHSDQNIKQSSEVVATEVH